MAHPIETLEDPSAPSPRIRAGFTRTEMTGFGVGVALVVLGGLVAAVTGPLVLARGSWLAAYLVLVAGLALCALAVQRPALGIPRPQLGARDSTAIRLQLRLLVWNAGNALVIGGTLGVTPLVVDIGGILLLAVLVDAALSTRGHRAPALAVGYRIILAVLIVSIPVGLVLAHIRAGS